MGNDVKQNPAGKSVAGQSQNRVQEFGQHHDDLQEASNRNLFLPDHEVVVHRLPEKLNSGEGQRFFHQVEQLLSATQPRFVFDFTRVRELDAVGIHLLLQCLEEVMKLNGDVKLAAVPPGPAAILELTGVNRLFEIFDITADAVKSFHDLPLHEDPVAVSLNASQTSAGAITALYGAD